MQRNFKLIWWFWIAEKEIKQRKVKIHDIIDRYYNLWIREFFIWYNPPYWHEFLGFEMSPNWRFWENEQITSYETLKEAINYVHTLDDWNWWKCEIFLTVNFRYYTDITMPLIKKIINEAIEAWINWLIIWNTETLEYLSEIGFKWKINVSTILSIYNNDAIEFLIDYFNDNKLQLNRIILPREVTLKEINDICSTFPEIQFEVFWHWDYCRYANWLCLAEHKYFSRDLCGFVLKHWLEAKKTVRYDFKEIILSETYSNEDKQKLISNELDEIEHILVAQNVVDSNFQNTVLDKYINTIQLELKDKNEIIEISNKIHKLIKTDLITNFSKYIYDWMRPEKDLHNSFIIKVLLLIEWISKYIKLENNIIEKVNVIKNICLKAKEWYELSVKEKWVFSIETYYKFLLYNRTSVPFYNYFNKISNIEVVKIPLRWRDSWVFWLWLNLIDDALEDPSKYIDYTNLTWKYFHYDPSNFDFYKDLLK